jgi:alkyl hydroperoxide reductase subunit AhpC
METYRHNDWQGSCKFPNCSQTDDVAPLFKAEAYDHGEKKIKEVSLESYRGKWVILFFYPSDFTFV